MRLSCIIPTWNAEPWLERQIKLLHRQTRLPDEILFVDSGSQDATRSLIQHHSRDLPQIRLLSIAQKDFDHGGTRTWAAQQSSGDILLFMTQDALPANEEAVAELVQGFAEDTRLAASYGRQLPYPEAHFFSVQLRRFNYPEDSQYRGWEDRQIYGFKTLFISNSFAAWRREALEEQGFFRSGLLFGEDSLALAQILQRSYRVAYVSTATVYHSHNYSIVQDFRRYFDVGVFHQTQQEDLAPFGSPQGAGRAYVASELALLWHDGKYFLLPEWFFRTLGKWLGYTLGKRFFRLPRTWAKHLSMHPNWWA
jgi:rhamnosyltransferase